MVSELKTKSGNIQIASHKTGAFLALLQKSWFHFTAS